jgi:hypothetical protein
MHPLAQIGAGLAGLACFGVFTAACFIGVAALIRISPSDPGDIDDE